MKNEILIDGPDRWLGRPELAADIMIRILEATYVIHNITNNHDQLVADIRNGTVMPWITRDETSCAALIRQSPTDVEIGRAACLPGTAGGKSGPITTAVARWKEGEVFHKSKIMRVEGRSAKDTMEVPGGQAIQVIIFKKLGFGPTGFGPFFHHGNPDQQEMFFLAHLAKDAGDISEAAKNVVIPKTVLSDSVEKSFMEQFWRMTFDQELRTTPTDRGRKCGFTVQDVGPFLILNPTEDNSDRWRDEVNGHFIQGKRFAMAKLNLTKMEPPEITAGAEILRHAGFRLVGFEPIFTEGRWSFDLLMGKLSKIGRTNLVMPSFTERVINHDLEDSLLQVSINWRKNEK